EAQRSRFRARGPGPLRPAGSLPGDLGEDSGSEVGSWRPGLRSQITIVLRVSAKTFYIETFGCQMNVHDSEKVIGTLMAHGYEPVDSPQQAGLVLYNTCSIRDKAEQKVFNRLQNFKREA